MAQDEIPGEFQQYVIDDVRREGDHIVVSYGGRRFGGLLRSVIPNELAEAIQPGLAILVRYHDGQTGAAGQVAQVLIRHPSQEGWAEVFADWI